MIAFDTTTTDPKFSAMLDAVITATNARNARNDDKEFMPLFEKAYALGLEIGVYARVAIDDDKVTGITLGYLSVAKFDEAVTLRFPTWTGPEINWYAMGDQSNMLRVATFAQMITHLTQIAQANS